MSVRVQHSGSRLLLILALVAALLAGMAAVQLAIGQRNVAHAKSSSTEPQYLAPIGSDLGGGH
jgi:hypothetical protein